MLDPAQLGTGRQSRPRRLRFGPSMNLSFLPLLLFAALALARPACAAENEEEQPYARLPESIRRVERETGGKVLQVRPIQRGGREVYRMKVLTPEGRVRIMQDDPRRAREPPPQPQQQDQQ